MKTYQYIIHHVKKDMDAEWEGKTILFDTQEEAEEMIETFPEFFSPRKHLEIKKGIYYIDDAINYKDLKETEDFLEEIENQ